MNNGIEEEERLTPVDNDVYVEQPRVYSQVSKIKELRKIYGNHVSYIIISYITLSLTI